MEELNAFKFQGIYRNAQLINNVKVTENVEFRIEQTIAAFEIRGSQFKNLSIVPTRNPQTIKISCSTFEELEIVMTQSSHLTIEDNCNATQLTILGSDQSNLNLTTSKLDNIIIETAGTATIHFAEITLSTCVVNGNHSSPITLTFSDIKGSPNQKGKLNIEITSKVNVINIRNSKLSGIACRQRVDTFESENNNIKNLIGVISALTSVNDQFKELTASELNYIALAGSEIQILTLNKNQCASFKTATNGEKDCFIGTLELEQPKISQYTYEFTNTKFGSLTLSNIKTADSPVPGNSKTILFEHVIIETLLKVEKCVLNSKTSFSKVDLSDCELTVEDSALIEAKYYSIRWREDYKITEPKIKTSDSLEDRLRVLWNLRETYRQLKVVSINNHNTIDAKQFLKGEIRIYYRIIKNKTGNSWKMFKTHFWDWLVLSTNSLFSDFGESVWRPLAFLFGINFLIFLLFIQDFNLSPMSSSIDWLETGRGLGIYLNLLNPVHGFKIEEVNMLGIADFFLRISSSYFLFYFIRATRKFHF